MTGRSFRGGCCIDVQSSRWCIGYDRAANDARPRWITARRPVDRLAVIPVASGVLCARSGAPDRHFADGHDSSHIYRPERGSGVQWTSDLVTNPGLGPSEERSQWTPNIIQCLMQPSLDVAEDC